MSYDGIFLKEGIYSPITQNQRHLELLRQLRRQAKGNILTQAIFNQYFHKNYRSVVVLANPKTVFNACYAKKEIKQQVIRADQLIEHIKKINAEAGANAMSERQIEDLAQFFWAYIRIIPKTTPRNIGRPKSSILSSGRCRLVALTANEQAGFER